MTQMNVSVISGKTRIYNTNGTGRDTYIGFNNGGNTLIYSPIKGESSGRLQSLKSHFRNGGGGSPCRTLHYRVDGTGRDSYIHDTDGGFTNRFAQRNGGDAYVQSLRGHSHNLKNLQRSLCNVSTK